jgi:hypothetical protein
LSEARGLPTAQPSAIGKLGSTAANGPCCGGWEGVRPHITINIKGVQVVALIDTGSTHTLVNTSTYHRLPRLTPLRTNNLPSLTSITNHRLLVRGICTLNIAGCPVDVTVCDDLGVDVLLGADFCHNAILDFQTGTFTIGDHSYSLRRASNDDCPVMTTKLVPTSSHECINNVLNSYYWLPALKCNHP